MTPPAVAPAEVLALVREIETLYRASVPEDPAVAGELARVLPHLRVQRDGVSSFSRSDHPVTAHLPHAIAMAHSRAARVAAALSPVAAHLPWRYSYARRADAPGLGQRIAFAELIGPEAPFEDHRFCLGLTAIAPGTRYPEHRHPAVELYHVLSGTAWWLAGERNRPIPPGEFVLHGSNVVHAMGTAEEPLLAVYTWTGEDVRATSAYV